MIHCCWLSGDSISGIYYRCLETWRDISREAIHIWTPGDITLSRYFEKTIREKKWGRASDYFRWWVLYTHGGTYTDLDVELHKPLYSLPPFLPYQTMGGRVDAFIAKLQPGSDFAKEMLQNFEHLTGNEPPEASSVAMITRALRRRGMRGYYDDQVAGIKLMRFDEQAKYFTHHYATSGNNSVYIQPPS